MMIVSITTQKCVLFPPPLLLMPYRMKANKYVDSISTMFTLSTRYKYWCCISIWEIKYCVMFFWCALKNLISIRLGLWRLSRSRCFNQKHKMQTTHIKGIVTPCIDQTLLHTPDLFANGPNNHPFHHFTIFISLIDVAAAAALYTKKCILLRHNVDRNKAQNMQCFWWSLSEKNMPPREQSTKILQNH